MTQNVIEKRTNDREDKDCNMNSLFDLVREFGGRLTTHMQDEAKQDAEIIKILNGIRADLDEVKSTVDSLTVLQSAFPEQEDGSLDLRGHRHYHTSKIKAYNEKEKRWKRIWDNLIEKGVTAVITGVVILLGYGFVTWIQITTAAVKP